MKKLINLLLGYVEMRLSGPCPERVLNLCALRRLRFWRLRRGEDGSLTLRVLCRDRAAVERIAAEVECRAEAERWFGSAAALPGLAGRGGFLAGAVLCLLAVSLLPRFLLVVEVEGNERVPTAVILSELQRLGVCPGAWGPAVDTKEICNEMLLAIPELAYLTVCVSGARAQVDVEERVMPPALLEEKTPADVVADADGIVEDIHPFSGRAAVAAGDIVAKGEVLIAGEMKLRQPQYGTADPGWLRVRASGEVFARTWRTLEETVPLYTAVKRYTGEERVQRSLHFLWHEIDFFQNSSISWEKYDRIAETEYLTLFGRSFPIGMTRAALREYVVQPQPLDTEAAARHLERLLRERLAGLMDSRGGEVIRTDVVCRTEGDLLTVTLLAECREQIGRTEERPGEVGRVPGISAEHSAE